MLHVVSQIWMRVRLRQEELVLQRLDREESEEEAGHHSAASVEHN
jgi:hypothetical protein